MTREEAKEKWEIIKAYGEGKTIQFYGASGEWHNIMEQKFYDNLTKAKELIKNIICVTWGEGWNYSLDWKVKAEQFIKDSEVEK